MRAIVLQETGGPEMLVPEEIPEPTAGAGQVLVRTEAIAISRAESLMRSGVIPLPFPLPAVIGAEAAGVVAEVGEGADPGLAGARVVMVTDGAGSYAELIAVDAGMTVRVPDGLSAVEAVASAAPGAMALALLDRLARDLGAGRIIATGGTPVGRGRVLELGADVVLDHADPDWASGLADALDGATLDVAFDAAAGAAAGQVLDHLTPGSGRMVCYGMLSGTPPVIDMAKVTRSGLHVLGCGGPGWFRQVLGVHYPQILQRAVRSRIKPRIAAVLPLAEAAEAHRRIDQRDVAGRIVLVPGQPRTRASERPARTSR